MAYLKKAMPSPINKTDCNCSPWMFPFKIFNTLKVRLVNFDNLTFLYNFISIPGIDGALSINLKTDS